MINAIPEYASLLPGYVIAAPAHERAALHHCGAYAMFKSVDGAADDFEFGVVVCCQCVLALFLEFAYFCLECRLVDAARLVMCMHRDFQCVAQRGDQVILVQLRVAFQRFVIGFFSLCDLSRNCATVLCLSSSNVWLMGMALLVGKSL